MSNGVHILFYFINVLETQLDALYKYYLKNKFGGNVIQVMIVKFKLFVRSATSTVQ